MAKPNDTTTVLNPGTGGDSMDESSVPQDDATTIAKRPRVVLGRDDGKLLDAITPLTVQLCAQDRALLRDIRDYLERLVRQGGGLT